MNTTLKELRMYHWRLVLACRATANNLTANPKCSPQGLVLAEHKHAEANMHIGFVQALNDLVPGTAEQDCMEEHV